MLNKKRPMNRIIIDLQERSYPIYVGHSILRTIAEVCRTHNIPRQLAIVTDKNVAKLYLKQFINELRHNDFDTLQLVIPPGEEQKSLKRANDLITELLKARFPRGGAIIAFGGGVVGDLAGFVAAVYRRGVKLIQVPTTLLGQMESSSGGKTGVNHPLTKNAIGAYHQPVFVLSDVSLLSTLPEREIICGLGEIVKYGLFTEEMFGFLDGHLDDIMKLDPRVTEETIVRCVRMKTKMISEDERETDPSGGRVVLNLGHTIGQALESLLHYKLHHGEAVLVGLRLEAIVAKEAGILDANDFNEIVRLIDRVGFRPKVKFPPINVLLKAITNQDGRIKFIFPVRIGEIVIRTDIKPSFVKKVLEKYC